MIELKCFLLYLQGLFLIKTNIFFKRLREEDKLVHTFLCHEAALSNQRTYGHL